MAFERLEQELPGLVLTEELREAGQLNADSEWPKVVHGERAYYGRRGGWDPEEPSLELPSEGVKDVRMSGAEDFERRYARAERMEWWKGWLHRSGAFPLRSTTAVRWGCDGARLWCVGAGIRVETALWSYEGGHR